MAVLSSVDFIGIPSLLITTTPSTLKELFLVKTQIWDTTYNGAQLQNCSEILTMNPCI